MTTLHFSVLINAPKATVWDVLWSEEGYRSWTSEFAEGSFAETDWKEGSSVHFLTPKGEGMFSRIKTRKEEEQMTFEHLGEIKDGKEEPKEWAGAIEDYQLREEEGITQLAVSVDANLEFHDYFKDSFPRALNKVKELAEKGYVNA
jgi:hypothetical protein